MVVLKNSFRAPAAHDVPCASSGLDLKFLMVHEKQGLNRVAHRLEQVGKLSLQTDDFPESLGTLFGRVALFIVGGLVVPP